QLTWNDLEAWVGERILSRAQKYYRNHAVEDIVQMKDGRLVAWVNGGERYITTVHRNKKELSAICTCPYGYNCKHGAALVLTYVESLKKNKSIPFINSDDPRTQQIEAWLGESTQIRTSKNNNSDNTIRTYLQQQNTDQLLALIEESMDAVSSFKKYLLDRVNMETGSVETIVKSVRKEIDVLSSEPAWENHWDNELYTSDYSNVKATLEQLIHKGHADEAIAIAKELFEKGIQQIEMSQSEGDLEQEIASCLNVVLPAFAQSSLQPHEQLLWGIDIALKDDYNLWEDIEEFVRKSSFPPDAWNRVAESLVKQLRKLPSTRGRDDFSGRYQRDRLTEWLIYALEQSGRDEEIIPLCMREAEETGSYDRLVKRLIEKKRYSEAKEWIERGISHTQERHPGIASSLRQLRMKVDAREKNWHHILQLQAEQFFNNPSAHAFQELEQAAQKAKVQSAIRIGALYYLETGIVPWKRKSDDTKTFPKWPLGEVKIEKKQHWEKSNFPITAVLIDIAIQEKNPAEILHWYDIQNTHKGSERWGTYWETSRDNTIAEAIAQEYPDRTIEIWQSIVEAELEGAKSRSYENAAQYLRKIRKILHDQKKNTIWQDYLRTLRTTHERKKKFIEILNRIEGHKIIDDI
ncbi:MAG TPA: SWIM zinc finger family protein, partial [Patescibacteria group bacterium]|nr:SWIM zinc finger family protein [Patescibacteria group bacterium]